MEDYLARWFGLDAPFPSDETKRTPLPTRVLAKARIMKTLFRHLLTALPVCCLMASPLHAENWTAGMVEGKPAIKSVSQLAFGPEGILFIADSKSAAIFAIATGDTGSGSKMD